MNFKIAAALLFVVALVGAGWFLSTIVLDGEIQPKSGGGWIAGVEAITSLCVALGGLIGAITSLIIALKKRGPAKTE